MHVVGNVKLKHNNNQTNESIHAYDKWIEDIWCNKDSLHFLKRGHTCQTAHHITLYL